jgi:hypothetical protein
MKVSWHAKIRALFLASASLSSPCLADDSPVVFGFSLKKNASELVAQYNPVIVGNKAFIYKESLQAPVIGVEYEYSGDRIQQLHIILETSWACINAIETLSKQLGEPSSSERREDAWQAAHWKIGATNVVAIGKCGDELINYRIILSPRISTGAT